MKGRCSIGLRCTFMEIARDGLRRGTGIPVAERSGKCSRARGLHGRHDGSHVTLGEHVERPSIAQVRIAAV
jgi:hypothetical protein